LRRGPLQWNSELSLSGSSIGAQAAVVTIATDDFRAVATDLGGGQLSRIGSVLSASRSRERFWRFMMNRKTRNCHMPRANAREVRAATGRSQAA